MPGAREGHHAVDHAAPGRRQQHQRHHHAEALRPIRQRGVVQVVRAGPDVHADQRPEVHDRQPVRIHRPLGLLGHEVVHHPEEAGSEEEAHGVVAVPPLDHRVGGAGVQRVGLGQGDRDLQVVDDVQDRHGDDEGAEEPVAYIDVLGLALQQGAEEHHRVGDPDHGDQQVDRPLQLGVFFRAGEAQRQADGRQQDHQLPAPEGERRQPGGEQRGLGGALHRVIAGGEQRAAPKGEDHRIGVQRAQAAEAGPRQAEVEFRPDQLRGDEYPHRHPDDPPDHRHEGKLADHLVVVGGAGSCGHCVGFHG
ncbi:hypothetical protein FQZ97_737730 [compost metagenome]